MKIKVTSSCSSECMYDSIQDYYNSEQYASRYCYDGVIEQTSSDSEFTSDSLGRLLDVLASKNILNAEEIAVIVTGNNYDELEFIED